MAAQGSDSGLQVCRFLLKKTRPTALYTPHANLTHDNLTHAQLLLESFTMPALSSTAASGSVSPGSSTAKPPLHQEGYQWFKIVIPLICCVGIVGNVLNLVVLTRRRMLSSMQRLERCATYGLAALAMSDMMLCVVVFPHTFVTTRLSLDNTGLVIFSLYYRVYGIALINLFMMMSNWLTVVIAINRFLVVLYPIRARYFLSSCKTLVSLLLVGLGSASVSLPNFLHLHVVPCAGADGVRLRELRRTFPAITDQLKMYNRWVWPILAVFMPLFILAFCNACLIKELNNAKLFRRNSTHRTRVKDTSHRVTLTLVIIVLMVFLLVSPSEILKYINPYASWGRVGHIVASVTNALQATNFALNFFLYCVVNPNFRRTISDTLLHCCMDPSTLQLDDSRSGNGHAAGEMTMRDSLLLTEESCGRPSQQGMPHDSDPPIILQTLKKPLTAL